MALVAKGIYFGTNKSYIGDTVKHICHSYTGFKFGNKHCSEFGIVRVSSADRYTTGLLPQGEEKSIRVPGQDGSYYFGNTHKTKTIPLEIAFDKLTKEKLYKMQEWLSEETTKLLVLDEAPYKGYYAKCDSMQSISYVPFDEEENGKKQTFYKGRGTLNFTCYYPYAVGTIEFLSDLPDINDGDWETEQWATDLGIPESSEGYNTISSGAIKVINCGDFPSYPYICFTRSFLSNGNLTTPFTLNLQQNKDDTVRNLFGIKIKFGSSFTIPSSGNIFFNTQTKRFEYRDEITDEIKFLTDEECQIETLPDSFPQEDFYIPPQHTAPDAVDYSIAIKDITVTNDTVMAETPYLFLT